MENEKEEKNPKVKVPEVPVKTPPEIVPKQPTEIELPGAEVPEIDNSPSVPTEDQPSKEE